MTHDKVRVIATHVLAKDKTTKIRVYDNKVIAADTDLSATQCYGLILEMLPAISNALTDKPREGYMVPHHGWHP